MKATEVLREEHDSIKLMFVILEKFSMMLQSGQGVNAAHLTQILEFMSGFVDKCHHGKEEELLFPVIKSVLTPDEGADPIGVMLVEHNVSRGYIKDITSAFNNYKAGDRKAITKVITSARSYINLLTQHIDKENNILFPIADKFFTQEKQEELLKAFEKLEAEKIGSGQHEEYCRMLYSLKDAYLS